MSKQHRAGSAVKKLTRTVVRTNASIERERLTSLINSMADGVIAIDEKGKIAVSNGAALNILDVNSSLAGKHITRVLKLIDKSGSAIDINSVILDTRTQHTTRDWRLEYPDGSKINLYVSIAPVRLGYGVKGMKGYVILLRDITREKSLEEERDEFISVVSHELRTPIAISEGNIGNAEFIFEKSGIKNDGIKQALKAAHDQINFLSGMINDLSTLSRAERGKLDVDVEGINVHDLLVDIQQLYEPDAKAKGLSIKLDLDPSLELLHTSKLYAKEVLQNFVTNAIKYTEEGHITIGADKKKEGVEFFVSDTGIGISKADQEKVFDKFFRSEDFRTRANNGTGLGLYVTMKLARLIQAEIDVESKLNHGSTFRIYVPNLEPSTA